jgi:tRNA(fMet)-specific endonuclease VapC
MEFTVLAFDEQAAGRFLHLRRILPQAGTQDLKIAAVCLTHDATLLTRNAGDFNRVPELRVENWLD